MKKANGFTLPEALVVVVIVAVLAVLLLPTVQSIGRSSKGVVCLKNLREIGGLLLLYAADHRATLPARQLQEDGRRVYYWMEALKRGGYVAEFAPANGLFSCPLAPKSTDRNECYGMRDWDGELIKRDTELPLSRIRNRSSFFLVADSINYGSGKSKQWYAIQKQGHNNAIELRHRGFANTVFSDGHAEPVGRDYFETLHLKDPEFTKNPFEVREVK